ncbi:hypothetical protein Kpol_1010p15 [Vanderwaltozyma polyspora DSM 70294]|uniref:Transcription initiation factor TFIID subunit 9 n=1 Tax=Vanderwaltozyma polyspora (strain ATCC 22028 / DSM 70294 / BCRC 21397 / CBS 2163 / NBRC 10782 / NRRL Y-8283 / UCD 57-17) TaxID=436907 RepID=A7TIG2_VANPO|nr:uncharacterized protein Kpol_1010p15 [Vanderwaltozyma polyspora DSM 70294]EDO17900.1 hypothetical protein Kpol_1010p15 [Vanderwaltozyma polyspora DSM 70294]
MSSNIGVTTKTTGSASTVAQEDIPRDVRLLHLLLASQSIHRYEDQVPLQLMDFAYRYTQSVLKDAIVYNDYAIENSAVSGNAGANSSSGAGSGSGAGAGSGSGNAGGNAGGSGSTGAGGSSSNAGNSQRLTVEDIRLAIAARTQYQFKPTAPKELLLQLASERNKKPLPQVMGSWGIRLPPEKYCLTAKEWDLDEEKPQD